MNERLKELRKHLGLTQEKFADRLSMKRNTIANYEIGRNEPIDAVIQLICKEFNVNETWLRTGEGEMFAEMDLEDELMQWAGTILAAKPDDFRKRFVRMLSRLSENEWELLAKMVTELVENPEKAADE